MSMIVDKDLLLKIVRFSLADYSGALAHAHPFFVQTKSAIAMGNV